MENQNSNESDQGSGIENLSRVIEQRRLDLGIKPGIEPSQVTQAMPTRELTPEEEQARREADARMALAEQKARRQGAFAKLCERAGQRYSRCLFKNYECKNAAQTAARDACLEYAKSLIEHLSDGKGLVLYGPVGTGKDHLAFAVCSAATLHHGKSVGWINGQDWFGEIRDQMGDDGQAERYIIMRLCAPDLLVISDPLPPYGNLTQHQATMLYRVVNGRYSLGRATIATLNVSSDEEADARLGAATWDRLCHRAWKIKCDWPSYRKPARTVNG